MNETITITFCESGENHVGMQQIGMKDKNGFSLQDLTDFRNLFEQKTCCELYRLNDLLDNPSEIEDAHILIIRDGINLIDDSNLLYAEQKMLHPDKKAYMKGRVCNKIARHNLLFSDYSQEANYSNKEGTIINFSDIPHLNNVRNFLSENINHGKKLLAEGNYYYDINSTYIKMHGDTERRKVIGVRLGATFPLWYEWYLGGFAIKNSKTKIDLNHGDIYIMSEKAVGTDWRRRSILTLRHAAGFEETLLKYATKKKNCTPLGARATVGGPEDEKKKTKKNKKIV